MRSGLKQQQGGFSLLEAIVAMTIMATSLLALYAWLSSNTLALNRSRDSAQALQDARSALAVMELINPMTEPTGRRSLPPLEIKWSSRPITEVRHGMSRSGTATQFDLKLYDMQVDVIRGTRLVRQFSFRKAGWEIARPISTDDF